MRQTLKKIPQNLGLIPTYHTVKKTCKDIKIAIDTMAFRSDPSFIPPTKELAYDAYGYNDWRVYHSLGLAHAALFSQLILKYTNQKTLHVLDWGCGSMRVLRHMPKLLSSRQCYFYGSDYNPNTIKWCKKNFKNMHFSLNGLLPPLSFEPNSFDVIYGLSVFTHLSKKSHTEWITELERVLKPNGILILTTHGDNFIDLLSEEEKKVYEANELLIRAKNKEGKRSITAFHPPLFVKDQLLNRFRLLHHVNAPQDENMKQDIWVVQKKG